MKEREIPTMAQKESLMQVQALVQHELSGHMQKAAHAVTLMKSHLSSGARRVQRCVACVSGGSEASFPP